MLRGLNFSGLVLSMGLAVQRGDIRWLGLALLTTAAACVLPLSRQGGHPAPMLPVDLLRRPLFALSALTSLCAFATQGLALALLPSTSSRCCSVIRWRPAS